VAFDIKLSIVGLNNATKFIADLPNIWRPKISAQLLDWGGDLKSSAEDLSPKDKLRGVDPRRRSEGERLAKQWALQLGVSGNKQELDVGNVDPKMPFILFPTAGGTEITPKQATQLLFFDTAGTIFRRPSVVKGFTPGQPVHEWALQEFDLDGGTSDLADVLAFIG
jgi:hypothetical protein